MGSVRLSRKRVTLRRLAKRRTHLLTWQSDPDAQNGTPFNPPQTWCETLQRTSPAEARQRAEEFLVAAH